MHNRFAGFGLVVSACLYSITSYLILLRDAFLLERVGISAGNRALESIGIALAQSLKVTYTTIPLLLLSITGLALSYLWIGRHLQQFSKKQLVILLGTCYIFFFASYPALSNDVFDYNNVNRVAYIHHANPWQYSADSFPQDDHIYLGSWIDRPTIYPPITFLFNSLVFLVFGGNPLVAMWGFKLVNLGLISLIVILCIKLFPKLNPTQLFWFVANPLLLIEFVGNAHNDLLLGTFLTLSVIFLLKKQATLSGIFFALSVLAKVSSVIAFPLILLHSLLENRTVLMRVLISTVFTGVIGLSLFVLTSPTIIETLTGQLSLYQKSLPGIIRWLGLLVFGRDQEGLTNILQKLLFVPLYLWVLIKSLRLTKQNSLVYGVVWGMLMYLLILAPMVQPWYLAWILPLIIFLKNSRLKTAVFVFSISSLLHYPLFYISLFLNPTNFIWQILLYLIMAVPPLLVLYSPVEWYTRFIKSKEL